MMEALCGNKNIQRILIFLFVNGKCYGTQLHRSLFTPLTPIQKALNRLEKGGIITSYFEGKTKLYQFNPAYPLIHELEQLLKKAYTLFSADEKKIYYVINEQQKKDAIESGIKNRILMEFWSRLNGVKGLTFHAKSKQEKDSNRKGQGEVLVTKDGAHRLIFTEKGSWHGKQDEVDFSNIFRWTLDSKACVISLEHLRRGPEHPVFLFHLAPANKHCLSSFDSHLCDGDIYFGQLRLNDHNLRLNWRVIGPKKNEEIDYYYS